MHIYTHLVLAAALEQQLQPEDPAAFYLGTIIPDVRYLSGSPRHQTHLTAIQLLSLWPRYPHLESFLLGYLVHCETDLIVMTGALFDDTALRLISSLQQLQLAGILIESHYLEQVRISPRLSFDSNEMLDELRINPVHVRQFAEGVCKFLKAPSFQAELAALQDTRLLANPRTRLYLRLVHAFETSQWLRKIILGHVPAARVAEQLPKILMASPVIKQFLH